MRAAVLCGLAISAVVLSTADGWGQTPKPASKSTAPKKQPAAKAQQGLRAPALKPLAPAQLFARGFDYFQKRQYDDAEALFREGLRRDDKDFRAWEVLARIYIAQEKWSDAAQALSEAADRGLPDSNVVALEQQLGFRLPVHTQRLYGKPSGVYSLNALGVQASPTNLADRQCRNPYSETGPKLQQGSDAYIDKVSVGCYFGEWIPK